MNGYEMSLTEIEKMSDGTSETSLRRANGAPQHKIGRLSAFANTVQGAEDAFAVGMWIRAVSARCNKNTPLDERAEQFLDSHGLGIQAAQTENTSTAGGYLVPSPLSNAIINIRERVGVARRLADVLPMTSDTLDVPKRTAGLTVYAPGEANTIALSDATFGQVKLVSTKRAVANQISQ